MTREEACAAIDRMLLARPTCAGCETRSYSEATAKPDTLSANGWEEMQHCAGYVKRCDACTNGQLFPWAARLDPDRVLAFVNGDPRCRHAFSLDLLRETL